MSKDTRSKLITTAKDLIISTSYMSIGVAEICRHAGVNKGSFYHFFKSKEELAIEALKDEFLEHKVVLNEVFSPTKSAMQQLDCLVEAFYTKQVEAFNKNGKVCGCPFINLGSEMATQKDSFMEAILKITKKYELYMVSLVQKFKTEELIDKNADVNNIAKTLHVYILGIKFLSKIENNPNLMKDQMKLNILNIIGLK